MKLSEVCRQYHLTDAVYKMPVECQMLPDGRVKLSFTDGEGHEYAATFEDNEITYTAFASFVVPCDGQPWEFIAWEKAFK